jgi:hypothetical protein
VFCGTDSAPSAILPEWRCFETESCTPLSSEKFRSHLTTDYFTKRLGIIPASLALAQCLRGTPCSFIAQISRSYRF